MTERWLHHVTLATGHVTRSPRSGVWDETIAALTPLLTRALRGEHVAIPHLPGYTITGGVHGRCCAITLAAQGGEIPILTVGIAPHNRCGAHLWRHLHDRAAEWRIPAATDRETVPSAPWCLDVLLHGAALYQDAMEWTGDFARSVAWTWIELRMGMEE